MISLNFLSKIIIALVVLVGAHLLLLNVLQLPWHSIYLSVYIYFPLISFVTFQMVLKQMNNRPQAFVTYFMGGMTMKLLTALGLLLVILYNHRSIKVEYTILFMTFYLVYTALSVSELFKKLRQKK